MKTKSLGSVLVRGASVVIKFGSLLILTKYFDSDIYENFILFVNLAGFVSGVFGIQSFNVVLREYNLSFNPKIFIYQLRIFIFSFLFLLLFFLIFYIPINDYVFNLGWLVFIFIIMEVIVFELSRFFIIITQIFLSNLVILINSIGQLTWVSISLYLKINPFDIMVYWIMFSILLNSLYYAYYLKKVGVNSIFCENNSKVYSLILSSLPFFGIQIVYLLSIYFTRFYLDFSLERESFSQYSLVFTIANVLNLILTVGVIAPLSSTFFRKNYRDFKSDLLSLWKYSVLLAILISIIYYFLIIFSNINILSNTFVYFLILLVSNVLLGITQIYNLILMKYHKDKLNFVFNILFLCVVIVSTALLVPVYGVLGACISFLISCLFGFFLRIFYLKYYLSLL